MNENEANSIRSQLLVRKDRLQHAVTHMPEPERYGDLIEQVDSALDKLNKDTLDICLSCGGKIEADRLVADPFTEFCLDCLSAAQQRELEADLTLASSIQHALLPRRDTRFDGWEVAYHYQPAGLVSGDYCDLIEATDNSKDLLFLLGDVSGKGIAASLLMSQLHAIFHSLSSLNLPLSELMERANHLLCKSTLSNVFITLIGGRLSSDGHLQLANAGHFPPILLSGGVTAQVPATGVPLGLFSTSKYEVRDYDLLPGDTLTLYTDGLNETLRDGEEYGIARIEAVARQHAGSLPTALIQAQLAELMSFSNGRGPEDDLTLMSIRRVG